MSKTKRRTFDVTRYPHWTKRDGTKIPIKTISTEHLLNILRMLLRKRASTISNVDLSTNELKAEFESFRYEKNDMFSELKNRSMLEHAAELENYFILVYKTRALDELFYKR